MGGEKCSFCSPLQLVRKQTPSARAVRALSPPRAIGSGTSSMFDLIVTRSGKVFAQGNNLPPLAEQAKKEPA